MFMNLQDFPGWGDDINLRRYLRTIITYILSRRAKDYDLLSSGGCSTVARHPDGDSSSSSSTQLKHCVTACLYFLPPHRMKQVDLVIMSAVSQLVSGQAYKQ
jgi:septin family protein